MSDTPTATGRVHEPLTDLFMGFTLDVDDPFPIYAQLRERNPVAWNATQGFWVASRHADCMTVSTSIDRFCSGKGILTFEIGADYATPPTMMHTDPPDHTRYRGISARRCQGTRRSAAARRAARDRRTAGRPPAGTGHRPAPRSARE